MTYDRVVAIIKSHLCADTVEPETKFTALGADSLDMLEIAMSLEEDFGIHIADDDMDDITTVQQCVDKVQMLL